MKKLPKRRSRRNEESCPLAGLPLFEFADRAAFAAPSLAVRTFGRRRQLSPSTAALVASLAGYPTEVRT
jgi:hypothetical protein